MFLKWRVRKLQWGGRLHTAEAVQKAQPQLGAWLGREVQPGSMGGPGRQGGAERRAKVLV